jgi:1-acyl-sn-glycerol-3-phosphate acyltransferase
MLFRNKDRVAKLPEAGSVVKTSAVFTAGDFRSIRTYRRYGMLNGIIVLAIIGDFIRRDLILRFVLAFMRGRSDALVERARAGAVSRIFALFRTYAGFRIERDGLPDEALPDRFLLVTNHQSLVDIPMAMGLIPSRPLRFVAKKELGSGVPLVSIMLKKQGQALIDRRGNATQAMNAISRFAERCRADGTCPVIFPEGTRSRDGDLGPFHTAGVRRILENERLPIVVAALEGGFRIAKLGDLFRNLRGGRYRLRILKVLPAPGGKKEALRAIEESRELIAAALADMRCRPGQ